MSRHTFTVTVARGMQPLLEQELNQLGIKKLHTVGGNVRFTGTLEQAYQVCMWSRVALRVLMAFADIDAVTPERLYESIKALDWQKHLHPENTLAVDFVSVRSKIHHQQFGAQRVKDAIVDQFREASGVRPSVDLKKPDVRVNVFVRHNRGTVSIDLAGDSLHKRGYRVQQGEAPIKEHLAAAILLAGEWQTLSNRGWGLLDPMCGSGTFLIEAAMIAADIAPGLLRDYFGFLGWRQHDAESWKKIHADALRRRQSGLSRLPVITGGDSDANVVAAARLNIQQTGLTEMIEVHHQDLLDWSADSAQLPAAGLLVCNPPYGQRLGDRHQLAPLYRNLGNLVESYLPGWRTAIITDTPELGRMTELTLFESRPFDNGPIACEVLYYRAPKPLRQSESLSENTAKVSTETSTPAVTEDSLSEQAEMFANRLRKNRKHLGKWLRKNAIEAYRLYDADLPDYAVAIDVYGDQVHVQEYAPPAEIDPLKASRRLEEVMAVVPSVLNVAPSAVALKVRKRQRGQQQYQLQAQLHRIFTVAENGLNFRVNLHDYLDTGLFLDHRTTRELIAERSRDKDVLNLFAYTGSVSVYAAAGGARSLTTVDMSNTYLTWAEENMQINGFESADYRFIRADCLKWLETVVSERQRYDLIFIDPPTFSNSNKMQGVFDVQRDHVTLIKNAAKLLKKGGEIWFSTNFRDFRIDTESLEDFALTDYSARTLPRDFERQPKIHYCWQLQLAK